MVFLKFSLPTTFIITITLVLCCISYYGIVYYIQYALRGPLYYISEILKKKMYFYNLKMFKYIIKLF